MYLDSTADSEAMPVMSYISCEFLVFVLAYVILYYALPLKVRWVTSLVASCVFYWMLTEGDIAMIATFASMSVVAYGAALGIEMAKKRATKRMFLAGSIVLELFLLVLTKVAPFVEGTAFADWTQSLVIPVGMSFFSLQLVAYIADVYRGKVRAERNFPRHLLFSTYFPQIIQGPIPRYGKLSKTLLEGNRFDSRNITYGFSLIVWGVFCKLMLADKAAIIVNKVLGDTNLYRGWFVAVAIVLYAVQLYTDFMACTRISQGVARLVGVRLSENFKNPYASWSIGEFWRRWHISLSSWLKDYVYIPLGGSRHGAIRKYLNVTIVFLVSGLWHGDGVKFLAWGALHAAYQVFEGLTERPRRWLEGKVGLEPESQSWKIVRWVPTMVAVLFGWLIFRAPSLEAVGEILDSMLSCNNPWIFTDGQIETLGLGIKELNVFVLSLLAWAVIEGYEVGHGKVCIWVAKQHLVVRWAIHLLVILIIWVFGTYGLGFNAADFIYGGF